MTDGKAEGRVKAAFICPTTGTAPPPEPVYPWIEANTPDEKHEKIESLMAQGYSPQVARSLVGERSDVPAAALCWICHAPLKLVYLNENGERV